MGLDSHAGGKCGAPVPASLCVPDALRPPDCTGTMAGDIGFDPLEISNLVPLAWSREVRALAALDRCCRCRNLDGLRYLAVLLRVLV